jgi:hypothetical protein
MQVDMVNRCLKQWTVVAHMGEMHESFWLENLKEIDYLGDVDLVGRTVLTSSEEQDLMVTCFLQILQQQQQQQQKDQQLQQLQQQLQSIQQHRMATSSAGLTPVTMQQQTLSSLQVSAAGGQLLQQQVLTPSSGGGSVVMAGSDFTYFVILLFQLQELHP